MPINLHTHDRHFTSHFLGYWMQEKPLNRHRATVFTFLLAIEGRSKEMSAKILSSADENRDLRKQIGCMKGIFQLFDRHHDRRISSHKRLLAGAHHQSEPHNATKAVLEKGLDAQKEKPRLSTESSQAFYPSSSCSSTISSSHNRTSQAERLSQRHTDISETPFQIARSPDIRDVVKDSMHREARRVSIKSFASDERKATVMKHVDSPRPLSKFIKPKAATCEGPMPAVSARFSYDGRESRDGFKKLKELPRLSLDSKTSSVKSRLNFDLNMENENSSRVQQEAGSHSRSSSIVAKLMGLDAFPETISNDEGLITEIKSSLSPKVDASHSRSSTRGKERPIQQKNHATTSPHNHNASSVRKPTTSARLPIETAPWKQQNAVQSSPEMAAKSKKAPANTPRSHSSVYGEMEKRITELEFKSSGKDLRALKQILEAMQKTKERLEYQRGESAEITVQRKHSTEGAYSNQNSKLPMRPPNRFGTSTQALIVGRSHVQFLQTQESKYNRKDPARREKAKDLTSRNSNMKDPIQGLPSIEKKTTWRNLEVERRAHQHMQMENRTNSGRGFEMASPRLQQKVLRVEGESNPNIPSSQSARAKKHFEQKVKEKSPQKRRSKVKSMDLQLSDDQLSELSSGTRDSSHHGDTTSIKSESNNGVASYTETEVISLSSSINTKTRKQQDSVSTSKEHMSAVEMATAIMEQPSPVSVLDAPFYSEDSPSPVKKISTAFQEDSLSPDEAGWHLVNLNHLTDFTKHDHNYKYNQMSWNMSQFVHEPLLLKTEPSETHNGSVNHSLNPGHRYINRIILESGLFKDTSIIPTADQLLSSYHMINPHMFHALEETEDAKGKFIEKNGQMKLNQKIQRRITFDVVKEMLVRKITVARLFTPGRKRISPQGLIKEIYLEIDHLCRKPYGDSDEEDDESIRLLTADMKYEADEWTDYSGEFPALVLDIERLIFKDLINEVVTGEVVVLHDWSRKHCRQLFTK